MSIFNQISVNKPNSNTFDLSHDRKFSMNMGELTPILDMDIVPGDKITMSSSQMLRLAPMIAPVMHKMNVFMHFFFVPNRILWDNWEDFITGGEMGNDTSVFPYITLDSSTTQPGTLPDYLGVPTIPSTATSKPEFSALPFAAYQTIWNEYYRDENLISPQNVTLVDGVQSVNTTSKLLQFQKRAWEHDYFTSALPWTQKGAEATIPLIGDATVISNGNALPLFYDAAGTTLQTNKDLRTNSVGGFSTQSGNVALLDMNNAYKADLSTASSASINDLRQAFRLQEWLEKNARGGTRYIESIKSHFGVNSSDARLQRPEYLGGGQSPVSISEVLQTSETQSTGTPQGNMAGHGINVGSSNNFSYYAQEHGYIIGIMSILPKTAYFQGTPKHFRKFDKFDYFWPSFAHLGEQAIQNSEIFTSDTQVIDEDTFGYTPRYAEYKFMLSSVHGEFKTSLDYWHMARKFATLPNLNADFISADPTDDEMTRIFAVTDPNAEKIYAHVYHNIKAKRLMPYFGTPRGV